MDEQTKISDLTVAQFRALMNDILDMREAEKARPKNQLPGYAFGSAQEILGARSLGPADSGRRRG